MQAFVNFDLSEKVFNAADVDETENKVRTKYEVYKIKAEEPDFFGQNFHSFIKSNLLIEQYNSFKNEVYSLRKEQILMEVYTQNLLS